MQRATDILLLIRGLGKLNDKCLETVRKEYELSQIEVTIMGFLHNNPGKDTVGEIAYWRMLPKGNVSQGVESLIQKRLLQRICDKMTGEKYIFKLRNRRRTLFGESTKRGKNMMRRFFLDFRKKRKNCIFN